MIPAHFILDELFSKPFFSPIKKELWGTLLVAVLTIIWSHDEKAL